MVNAAESKQPQGNRLVGMVVGAVFAVLLGTSMGQVHAHTGKRGLKDIPADTVLLAMDLELARSMATLGHVGAEPAPYFIAYTAKEQTEHTLQGKLGGIQLDDSSRQRLARASIRVGSHLADSSEDEDPEWPYEDIYEPSAALPLADHIEALRHTFWLLTDLGYKQATSSYFKLMAEKVYRAQKTEKRASFSTAPVVQDIQPMAEHPFDREHWRHVVKRLGQALGRHSHLFDTSVEVLTKRIVRWHLNSEGTRLRTTRLLYEIHAQGWIRAKDGMLLQDSVDFYGPTEGHLPKLETLMGEVDMMAERLRSLADAEELGPYTGPAILGPRAAGVFFHEVLGHRLEGHRQDDSDEGQTFTDHLKRRIMPTFLSVRDDPTSQAHGSVQLNGSYTYDEEGVKAQAVTLVDRGVLKAFLMSRRPAPGFEGTNGHARAEGLLAPTARMGNLIVEAHKSVTPKKLKSMLLTEVRRQKKPYGLYIRDISGGSTNTSSYGYQAFKGEARMVYRVDAKTGRETLVRGVDLVGTPLVSISKIVAASDRQGVFNGYCGAESGVIPVSTVAPAILFREVELQRSVNERAKPPLLPAPPKENGHEP